MSLIRRALERSLKSAAYVASWMDVRQTLIDRTQTNALRNLLKQDPAAPAADPAIDWNLHPSLSEFLAARSRLENKPTEGRNYLEQSRQHAPWTVQILRQSGHNSVPHSLA